MPQLAKGGKHVFGWAKVDGGGGVVIPPAAVAEYRLGKTGKAVLLSGSVTSGGFSLMKPDSLRKAPFGSVLEEHPELTGSGESADRVSTIRGRTFCGVDLKKGRFILPPRAMAAYGVTPGGRLLVIRGSGLGPGFAVRGPIIDEAKRHPELEVFE